MYDCRKKWGPNSIDSHDPISHSIYFPWVLCVVGIPVSLEDTIRLNVQDTKSPPPPPNLLPLASSLVVFPTVAYVLTLRIVY